MDVFGGSRAGTAAEGEGDHGGRSDVSPVLRLAPGTGAVLMTLSGPPENHTLPGRCLPDRLSKPGFPPTTSTYTDDFNHGYLRG